MRRQMHATGRASSRNGGFSLIEVLFVMVIIGILAAISNTV